MPTEHIPGSSRRLAWRRTPSAGAVVDSTSGFTTSRDRLTILTNTGRSVSDPQQVAVVAGHRFELGVLGQHIGFPPFPGPVPRRHHPEIAGPVTHDPAVRQASVHVQTYLCLVGCHRPPPPCWLSSLR